VTKGRNTGAEPAEWEKITPQRLAPAVEHIRESFDTTAWKYSEVTRHMCYAALHPGTTNSNSLVPYQTAFLRYRNIVGAFAEGHFDDLVRAGTLPSIFKAYLEIYRKGIEADVHNHFHQVLQIGLANASLLKMHPVNWAQSHLNLLNNGNAHMVRLWIMRTCDKQDHTKPPENTRDFEEVISWNTWRAPMLIHMKPSGNTPYDPKNTWTREDEPRTKRLLEAVSNRFIEYAGFYLDTIAGEAHVRFAQTQHSALPSQKLPARAELLAKSPIKFGAAGSGALLSKYRSELKRSILIQLTQDPNATDNEICRGLDADGAVELPLSWKSKSGDRLFADAYADRNRRRRIEVTISKIRSDLRKQGLLGPR